MHLNKRVFVMHPHLHSLIWVFYTVCSDLSLQILRHGIVYLINARQQTECTSTLVKLSTYIYVMDHFNQIDIFRGNVNILVTN